MNEEQVGWLLVRHGGPDVHFDKHLPHCCGVSTSLSYQVIAVLQVGQVPIVLWYPSHRSSLDASLLTPGVSSTVPLPLRRCVTLSSPSSPPPPRPQGEWHPQDWPTWQRMAGGHLSMECGLSPRSSVSVCEWMYVHHCL